MLFLDISLSFQMEIIHVLMEAVAFMNLTHAQTWERSVLCTGTQSQVIYEALSLYEAL